MLSTSGTGTSRETPVHKDCPTRHCHDHRMLGDALHDRLILLLRPPPHNVAGHHAVRQGPHLGHMTHNGPNTVAKRQFGKEKS